MSSALLTMWRQRSAPRFNLADLTCHVIAWSLAFHKMRDCTTCVCGLSLGCFSDQNGIVPPALPLNVGVIYLLCCVVQEAPEPLSPDQWLVLQVLRRNYSMEADIWSLGVMLYILLSGLPPFWGDTEEDIFRMVLKVRLMYGLWELG
jgi:hypothetical protein